MKSGVFVCQTGVTRSSLVCAILLKHGFHWRGDERNQHGYPSYESKFIHDTFRTLKHRGETSSSLTLADLGLRAPWFFKGDITYLPYLIQLNPYVLCVRRNIEDTARSRVKRYGYDYQQSVAHITEKMRLMEELVSRGGARWIDTDVLIQQVGFAPLVDAISSCGVGFSRSAALAAFLPYEDTWRGYGTNPR